MDNGSNKRRKSTLPPEQKATKKDIVDLTEVEDEVAGVGALNSQAKVAGSELSGTLFELKSRMDESSAEQAKEVDLVRWAIKTTEKLAASAATASDGGVARNTVNDMQPLWREPKPRRVKEMISKYHRESSHDLETLANFNYNTAVMRFNAKCGPKTPFRVFRKNTDNEVDSGIPACLVGPRREPELPEVYKSDTIPRAYWPRNYGELQSWSFEQIDDLGRILDEDFGILPTDSIVACRRKVYQRIGGE